MSVLQEEYLDEQAKADRIIAQLELVMKLKKQLSHQEKEAHRLPGLNNNLRGSKQKRSSPNPLEYDDSRPDTVEAKVGAKISTPYTDG